MNYKDCMLNKKGDYVWKFNEEKYFSQLYYADLLFKIECQKYIFYVIKYNENVDKYAKDIFQHNKGDVNVLFVNKESRYQDIISCIDYQAVKEYQIFIQNLSVEQFLIYKNIKL